jgi:hypothetical protein
MRVQTGAAARDIAWILAACAGLVLLLGALGRLGLPIGLRVVPMGEDYNWLIVLNAQDAVARAQTFWGMNDRNPLSPWWYIAMRRVYAGMANGPYLVRLLMNPLLGIAAYLAVRMAFPGRNRALALSVGLIVALWSFSTYIDQIYWNFLGALALSLLSVAAFAGWLHSGRRATALYGLSLCLWFAAFTTYTFQVGAMLAVGLLALAAQLRERVPAPKAVLRAALEALPFALLLALFLLVWTTTRNPGLREYYALRPDLLLTTLPSSLLQGIWPLRYAPYLRDAQGALGVWLLPVAVLVGLAAAFAVRRAARAEPASTGAALGVVAVAACLVLPTALIESMSHTWSVGMRWVMVDQAWQPLLWLGLAAALAGLAPVARAILPIAAGLAAALTVSLSLGHNVVATALSANEAALRRGVVELARGGDAGAPRHIVVLVADGVALNFADVLSGRAAQAWMPDSRATMRILRRGAQALEPGHMEWWNVVVGEKEIRNIAVGGGAAARDDVAFAHFDGRSLVLLERLTPADVAGYPVEWRRAGPLERAPPPPPPAGCVSSWTATAPVGATGLRALEQEAGGAFRWMVANPATISLGRVCEGPADIEVVIVYALHADQLASLTAQVGGERVPLQISQRDGTFVARGRVAALASTPNAQLQLQIDALRTVPGTSVQLGLALREVTLRLAPH